jgi:hypothetical protein
MILVASVTLGHAISFLGSGSNFLLRQVQTWVSTRVLRWVPSLCVKLSPLEIRLCICWNLLRTSIHPLRQYLRLSHCTENTLITDCETELLRISRGIRATPLRISVRFLMAILIPLCTTSELNFVRAVAGKSICLSTFLAIRTPGLRCKLDEGTL